MIKSDVTCPACNGGYRRIELASRPGPKGEFRCLVCDQVLEVFDGTKDVALRLTVQPVKRGQSISRLASLRHTFHS
ncbi:transposase-like protein [Bradyrhizobium sp. AZCC 2289]